MVEAITPGSTNIVWHDLAVDKPARAPLKGQQPAVLWFTGLSGAGKSTIANLVDHQLHALGHHTYILDGDNVRHGLNRDLGFTDADRVENIRRAAEVARLMVDAGLIVMVSFISPFRSDRDAARERFEAGEFIEVFIDTPIDECRRRDPKGLYARADAGRSATSPASIRPTRRRSQPSCTCAPPRPTRTCWPTASIEELRRRALIA